MSREAEKRGNYFLCEHRDAERLLKKAEEEKRRILKEFAIFYHGAIDVIIYPVRHVTGTSIAGALTVNGEKVREYDPVDLCFLDMNELMLTQLAKRRKEATP